jgi:hypothetical protein
MPPRLRPATGLNAFTDAALENKLHHIVSLLAERRGAAQVRSILLGLEPSEITASEDERDAEEPQHTCKLAARLLNKSSDAEPASSDEDTPSPSPPPAPSKRKLLADALAAFGDFATRAVRQREDGGSKAVGGRVPMPDKYTKKCQESQRPPITFLDDVLRYTEAAGFDPVAHFSSFLEGEVRQDWADIEEVWRKDGTVVTWEMLSEQFIKYVGVDPLERRDQAYEALFTEALHQQPDEPVRTYTQRFTTVLARLPSNALSETARCHAYVAHLLPQYLETLPSRGCYTSCSTHYRPPAIG